MAKQAQRSMVELARIEHLRQYEVYLPLQEGPLGQLRLELDLEG